MFKEEITRNFFQEKKMHVRVKIFIKKINLENFYFSDLNHKKQGENHAEEEENRGGFGSSLAAPYFLL